MNNKKYPNLKPWKPGESGNPSGRKPGSRNVSSIVSELLDKDANSQLLAASNIADLVEGQNITYIQAVALAMIKKALEGNVQAACWVTEQHERNYTSEKGLFQASKLLVEVVPSMQSTVD